MKEHVYGTYSFLLKSLNCRPSCATLCKHASIGFLTLVDVLVAVDGGGKSSVTSSCPMSLVLSPGAMGTSSSRESLGDGVKSYSRVVNAGLGTMDRSLVRTVDGRFTLESAKPVTRGQE